ncbi:MAG: peptidase M48 [Campylobacteraceae bacterium 4484_166]|nr:MAG: peptidase M48 [Campylobacteraceae bacterium 4484_166]
MKYIYMIFVSLLLTSCSYSSSTSGGTVGADRKQMMLVSAGDMRAGSAQAYKKVLSDANSKGLLNKDKKTLNRIRAIAKRLIPHTRVFKKDAPAWKWEVNLISSKELNAWCMSGGKIAFYTGIIESLKLNDGQIAAIMGHEIAHALREHNRERASSQAASNLGMGLLKSSLGLGSFGSKIADVAYNVGVNLPFSRSHETEADRIGVELSARAGYDPREAIRVWEKMAKLSKGAPPEILSTHPSSKTRIKDLTKYAKKVMPLYNKAKR